MSNLSNIRNFKKAIWAIPLVLLLSGQVSAQKKVMPMGDSIAKGLTGSTNASGFRDDLQDSLSTEGITFDFVGRYQDGVGFDPDHEGFNGLEANELLDQLRDPNPANNPLLANATDIILLHIGTNDITSQQGTNSTRDEVSDIIDEIVTFDNTIDIILTSLIPRNDARDADNDELNALLFNLYIQKRDAGVRIFWAGLNEIFKCNPNWAAQWMSDPLHPNDAGYAVMAGGWIGGLMNAINNSGLTISDNFERINLGSIWDADPEYVIQQNGANKDLVNTATVDSWEYLAVYKPVIDPKTVRMTWSTSADAAGIELSGLAVFLDSCDPSTANGYAITVRSSQNKLRLWPITNGVLQTPFIDQENLVVADPGPGDELKVDIAPFPGGHIFTVYINGQVATNFPLDDVGFGNQQGGGSRLHAGVILHGNLNNDVADFSAEGGGDFNPPAQITDLAIVTSTATSAKFSWTAVGDDGNTGTATSYDFRYSTTNIQSDADFNSATQATGLPNPGAPGSPETYWNLDLNPETTYFFANKAVDDAGNKGPLSNVPSVTTGPGQLVVDDFNRAGPDPGTDWNHTGTYAISSNEFSNTSTNSAVWDLAVFNAAKNGVEVSFKWSPSADDAGIDQGGVAVMLDSPTETAKGYLITRRTAANQLRLWEIPSGGNPTNPIVVTPNLGQAQPGDELRVKISSDAAGNHFDIYINGELDQTITDAPPVYIDPSTAGDLYSGVFLAGGKNNNVDDFKVLTAPISITKISGDFQNGTAGSALDSAIVVKLLDGNGDPIVGSNVLFEITQGGGTLNDPSGNIIFEAESGILTGNMTIGSDAAAAEGLYIHLPEAGGVNNASGDASYTFTVTEDGFYYVWTRLIAPDGTSDSFFLTMDGGIQNTWAVTRTPVWAWDRFDTPFSITAGQHNLILGGREDGTQADQILITKDAGFVPSGMIIVGQQLTVATNVNGDASATWVLGPSVAQNPNLCRASFSGFFQDFTATANAGPPATITKTGDLQVANPGTQVILDVTLTDLHGNAVPNQQTDWTVILGNGTLTSAQLFTDALGQAGNTLTTATDTAVSEVQLTSPGYTGPDVIFKTFATAGPADMIVQELTDPGDNQTGTAGKPLAKPFRAMVTDALGSPVSGHSVTFTVISGGGNFGGQSSVTVQTVNGVAEAILTLGPSPGGTNVAQATGFFSGTSTPLNGSPVAFTATAAIPQDLVAVSPLSNTGTAGVPLSDSIEVRVLDALGGFLPGHTVTFSVTAGGGSVNGLSSIVVTTDNNGIARVQWTLGSSTGVNNNSLQVTSTYLSNPLSGSPILFTSSAVSGSAQNLTKISGDSLSGQIQTTLTEPFVVMVTDGTGNAIAGWPVTFTVTAGDGKFVNQSSVTVSTDIAGKASATLTLGVEAGTPQNPWNNVIEATAQNLGQALNGSPVTFLAQAIATDASNLQLVQGSGQTGPAGQPLSQSVQVKVTDDTGVNGVANHPVTFTITNGGGTINGSTEVSVPINTDGTGIAQVIWYLGGSLGTNAQSLTITATDGIDDLAGSPLTITATATTGPVDLDVSTIVSDKSQVPADGSSIANITVTLTDKFGNPINFQAVFLEVTGSSNSVLPTVSNTNSSGKAGFTLSSTTAQSKTITAKVVGAQNIPLNNTVNVQFTANQAERITLNDGNNQDANVGTAVADQIAVLVTDNFNNGVPGIPVNFVVTSGGGFIIENNPVITDQNGIASADWVLGASVGTNRVEARANGLTGSPSIFTATGLSANATRMAHESGRGQDNFPAGSPLPQPLQVKVTDGNGKVVAGVTVNFTIQFGNGTVSDTNPQTDYRGIAETVFTLGPSVGTNIVQATNSSLTGSPIPFNFTSVVGGPAKLLANSGTPGTGRVKESYAISAKVTDLNDNAVQGAQIGFQVMQGGAIIQANDNSTGPDGTAAAQLELPETIGTVIVRVTSNDLPGFFQDFIIEVTAGQATTIDKVGGDNQAGTVGRDLVFPLEVMVTDTYGNPVPDFEVAWVKTIGNGSLQFGTTTTGEEGTTSNVFTLGTTPGANTAVAVTALAPPQRVFNATGVTNNFPQFVGLTDMTVTEGNLLEFQVLANDADGHPIGYSAEGPVFNAGASFNPGNRTFSWTPGLQQSDTYEATFIATDNQGGFDSETIIVTVVNSNNPPQILAFQPTSLDFDFNQGNPINFSVSVDDADGDQLSFTWFNNGSTVSTQPTYQFITSEATPQTYLVTVEVSDGQDKATLTWKIDVLITSIELASFSASFEQFTGVRISWLTSREVDNTGFNVLRSRSESKGYEAVNPQLIPPNSQNEYFYIDNSIAAGTRYYYMLEDIDINGTKTQHGPLVIDVAIPERFELAQNYPNPFNPTTNIRYQLARSGSVKIKVFDILGREVRTLLDQHQDAGFHIAIWNARDDRGFRVSSGVYFYQIVSGEFKDTKKMLLLK